MWISRAVVLACVASFSGQPKTLAATPRQDAVTDLGGSASWNEASGTGSSSAIDLFPLLNVSLRRDVVTTIDDEAPEPMNGESRAIAYPMVPAPAAGESGLAFVGLLIGALAYRFWRYGQVTFNRP